MRAASKSQPVEINETAASVLGFLSLGPLTGWDLNEFAQVSVGHFWSMTRSQVYRELNALAHLGLVEAEEAGPRNRRRYHLTAAGRTRLLEWLRLGPDGDSVRNPFLVKLFFAQHLTDEEVDRLVARARGQHERAIERYEDVLAMADALSPFAGATARYGLAVERALLDWFDAAPWKRQLNS